MVLLSSGSATLSWEAKKTRLCTIPIIFLSRRLCLMYPYFIDLIHVHKYLQGLPQPLGK